MIATLDLPARPVSALAMFAIVLTAVLVMYYAILDKPLKEGAELSRTYTEAQENLNRTESSQELARDLEKNEKELTQLRKQLYFQSEGRQSSEIVPYVVGVLDGISRKYNIRLLGVTPLEVTKVLMLEELPFDITISGSYRQIYQWMAEAEQALNPMAVKFFSISPSRSEPGVTMKMRVVSYRLPLEEEE